ncbi:hypothetical protein GCM10008018_55900 [Paenibacillus marchantiophytorum]|uniref:Sugar phosphate isomerase/epimerase n=1 Tax=Paenibacillus marchantiophytorum TaxID=1619310 RepID=A0ABQ1F868_9BACL|nr:sugar phosphate isomerase/epimerase [Paenibacillus marchantiophytorum]GGA02582.1 hypothetical protein GCM10008018_55900 [Paenibacillus marchantiophytorum]
MKATLFKSFWGMEHLSLEEKFALIASQDYFAGIECPLPTKENESQFRELLSQYGFDYIAMIFTAGDDHLSSFEAQIEQALRFNPRLINAHSAKDSMPYQQQLDYFDKAIAVQKSIAVPVGHETHRGRAMFTPWGTAQLLRDLPELQLTADFSHWCCVCESLLEDQKENLALAIERTIHIHSRVGYSQGPQVPHPAAAEYQHELATHMGWWEQIVAIQEQKGLPPMTITPEFGPSPYMPRVPFTNEPVSDLWEVCLWMAAYIRDRK